MRHHIADGADVEQYGEEEVDEGDPADNDGGEEGDETERACVFGDGRAAEEEGAVVAPDVTSKGGRPPTDQAEPPSEPADTDSEVAQLSDQGQADLAAFSRAESSLGESCSVLAGEEWGNASRADGDDAPSADDVLKSGAAPDASEADEARHAASEQGPTCTPEEIFHLHLAHFRDVRRFAHAQYVHNLRPHHNRLATLLRVRTIAGAT